jgi:hypothetical protein
VFQDLLGEGILAREVMIEGPFRNVGKFQDLVDPSRRVASGVYLFEANFDEFFSCSMVRHNFILDWSTPQKNTKLLRDLVVESALAAHSGNLRGKRRKNAPP